MPQGRINRVTSVAAPVVALIVALVVSTPARAVIIDTLTGTGNTSAPVDDPGWDNVGYRGIGTGVYVGNRWVLTASHVWSGSIVLPSGTYALDPGSEVTLTNNGAPGKSTYTDLVLYRLTTDPGLPTLSIAATAPADGTAVTLIGAGRDRGAFQTWNVNTGTTPWIWTPSGTGVNFTGYGMLTSRAMRWGTNQTSGTGWIAYDPGGGVKDVNAVATTFDDSGSPSSESQAAFGDSGGAMFVKNGGTWDLAGMMLVTDAFSGQPGFTAVYGNNTYLADLSFYRPQILAVVVPEPSMVAAGAAAVIALAGAAGRRRRRQAPRRAALDAR
jgi:MYXO-CTERM domain-containing protein